MNYLSLKKIIFLMVLSVLLISPGSAVDINSTIIDPGDQAYVQFEFWICLFVTTILFLILSFILPRCTDICAVLATLFASVTAYITLYLEFFEIVAVGETAVLVHYTCHHTWLALLMLAVFLVCVLNTFRVAFDVYWLKESKGRI
jgi:hypothetical protein